MKTAQCLYRLKQALVPLAIIAACLVSLGTARAAAVRITLEGGSLELSQPLNVTATVLSVADRPPAAPPTGYLGPCYRVLPDVPLDGTNTLAIQYNPGDVGAIPEDALSVYWYDSYGGAWMEMPSAVDARAKTVVAWIDRLGTFALSAPRPEDSSPPQTGKASAGSAKAAPGPATASAVPGAPAPIQAQAIFTVLMTSFQYMPREITVPAGSQITWTNEDPIEHTVTADPANPTPGGPNSDTDFPNGIPAGQSWTWQVPATAAPGTKWFYHCRFHGLPGDGTTFGAGMSGSVTIQGFEDVPNTLPQAPYIYAIFNAGITGGCSVNPPLYCPFANITRAQMAVFLCKAAGKQPLNRDAATFADVPKTHWAYGYVERLADAASWPGGAPTGGCRVEGTTKYFCPNNAVTREQMAKFLCLATGTAPMPSCSGMFADVPSGNTFCPFIERLANAASWPGGVAVTSGCACPAGFPPGAKCYCPGAQVTRGDMAVFLVRAFGIPL
jgi:plastocyanin